MAESEGIMPAQLFYYFHKVKGGLRMDQFIPLISEVGFPIIVTLYLLHRIEAKLDTVVLSIQNLPNHIKDRTSP